MAPLILGGFSVSCDLAWQHGWTLAVHYADSFHVFVDKWCFSSGWQNATLKGGKRMVVVEKVA